MSIRRRIAALALAGSALAGAVAADCTKVQLGAGVTLAETTAVGAILDEPEKYVGREVVVDGEVADVCQAAGCWLELRAAEGGRTLKVKVEDGEIVFPKDSRGARARAQGKVERMDLDREGYILHREHEAHEQGTDFDSSGVPVEGPWPVYRIRGTGAELCR
jgi:hypothetical protein